MISKQEIMDLAWEFSLDPNTVEKDYVLGWLLAGIANQPDLFNALVFKGGTCLKKCYFETFRFSEDLDYTLRDREHMDERFFTERFHQVASWLEEAVGIEIPPESIQFERYKNRAGREAILGRMGYIGPMQRRRQSARIRLDLTADEILVSKPCLQAVHHPYSDKSMAQARAYSYSFQELFAEKIRALSERARPRDLYDVVHIYRHLSSKYDSQSILQILKKKCEYKTLPTPTMAGIETHEKLPELESEWANMLGHQLPNLPTKEAFWDDLPHLFTWLTGASNKTTKAMIPVPTSFDSTWHPPSMIQSWNKSIPFELIRYAGANHLCVKIKHANAWHLIEPYDLKKNHDGHLILMTLKHDTEEIAAYPIEEIRGIELTEIPFEPRYLITLTPVR